MIKKIGVMTSGGDAPGMNACVRAVVRSAVHKGVKVVGFRRGYEGVIDGDILELGARDVSDIISKGGTMLLTARSDRMMTEAGQDRAAKVCEVLGLDALIVIGGDGSFRGGLQLIKRNVNVFGIPATIDLDLNCSEYTIGFDTAVNTAMDAINRIRDTSSSHERCSIVEVMGRDAGYIALWCGLAGGAEEIMVPEDLSVDSAAVINQIILNRSKGKTHNLIIVAEGRGNKGRTEELAKKIEETTGISTRATILGHLQRGGTPTAVDRMHAAMMGYRAVEGICNGEKNRVMVFKNGRYASPDFDEAMNEAREYDGSLYDIAKILAI